MDAQSPRTTYAVAVLAGGRSARRAESLASGSHVAKALDARRHLVARFDPFEIRPARIPWSRFDACFIALPLDSAELVPLQERLSKLAIAFTGSGPEATRLARRKSAVKERLVQFGVPTPSYFVVTGQATARNAAGLAEQLGCPVVLKSNQPADRMATSFVSNACELADVLAQHPPANEWLIEPWLDGREFQIAVIGRRALCVVEVITARGLCDHQTRREAGADSFRLDTGLPDTILDELRWTSALAAESVGAAGLVCVDVMIDRQNRPWVLSIDTNPSLAAGSPAIAAGIQGGLDAAGMCDWLLRDALRRRQSTSVERQTPMVPPIVVAEPGDPLVVEQAVGGLQLARPGDLMV